MTDDLREALSHGVVEFTFKKANGELRKAIGTTLLDPSVATGFTDADIPKGCCDKNGVVAFWDCEKMAWRSCKEDSIVSIDKIH